MNFDASTSAKVSALEDRLTNLQKQLDESNKKQNVIQEKLDSLISWIKSIFPFFK
jgi:hypothetical protein